MAATTDWRSITDQELKGRVRAIATSSRDEATFRRRVAEELGYPYRVAVDVHPSWGAGMRMFSFMLHGRDGKTI